MSRRDGRERGSWPVRLGRRLWDVGGTLLARDTMVVTNAIAFNFLLCLFPLLLVLVAAAQALPGRRASNAVLMVMHEVIPFEREALAQSVQGLRRIAPGLQVFSLLMIVWGSSGIFMPIEMALARAWGSAPRTWVKSRALAFAATLGGGLLAFLSVAVTVLARSYNDVWPRLAEYGARASALMLTYVLFFLIYLLIPSPSVGGGVALRSALWAGTAWEGAKYLFVINLARTNLRLFYGPLAFAVALVLWAQLSSMVLVFGALMVPGRPARRRE
jgi:membrane protein/epoxyqueuosine reductase